jgi:hypothetical protein
MPIWVPLLVGVIAMNQPMSTEPTITAHVEQRRSEVSYRAPRDTTDQKSTGHWSRTAIGAGIGLVVGAIAGAAEGRHEDRSCGDGPCGAPAIRGVEFAVLGSILGAVIGSHWHHQ